MDDDEDSFLYGDTSPQVAPTIANKTTTPVEVISVPAESADKQGNGIVAHLEAEAAATNIVEPIETDREINASSVEPDENGDAETEDVDEEEGEEGEEDEESEDDIEFILEAPSRTLDLRSQRGGHRPNQPRTSSAAPQVAPSSSSNLLTEYTPRERSAQADSSKRPTHFGQTEAPPISSSTPAINTSTSAQVEDSPQQALVDDAPDPSTLPPVRAPPSHPSIDPNTPGVYEGRSIFEVDMTNLSEKPWRRPGSDISDWFNYGFDELSWEAYCFRRRALGEMATVLKANVLNFAGIPEEQLLALPPEARTMVLTGTHAMMMTQGGGPSGPPGVGVGVGPGMMPPVNMAMGGINPMMAAEMGAMGPMGQMMNGPMGMGMNGEMGVGMQGPAGPMMQDGGPVQVLGQGPGGPGTSGTPEQAGQMALPDGMPGAPGMMNMGMNMGPDFATMQKMQEVGGLPGQQIHPNMDQPGGVGGSGVGGSSGSTSGNIPVSVPSRGGPSPAQFRSGGRGGMPAAPRGARGIATFPPRGRGRGSGGQTESTGSLPVRPPSPLPPNVPTGPRNQGKYRDRDGYAPAVEGLDYGGGGGGGGSKESSVPVSDRDMKEREREREREREIEEKAISRKRRSPPNNEEDRMSRSSKRR